MSLRAPQNEAEAAFQRCNYGPLNNGETREECFNKLWMPVVDFWKANPNTRSIEQIMAERYANSQSNVITEKHRACAAKVGLPDWYLNNDPSAAKPQVMIDPKKILAYNNCLNAGNNRQSEYKKYITGAAFIVIPAVVGYGLGYVINKPKAKYFALGGGLLGGLAIVFVIQAVKALDGTGNAK